MDKETIYSETDFNNYFKIRKTVMKMLEDRGYIVSELEKEMSFDEWKNTHKDKQLIFFLTGKNNDRQEYIFVESSTCPKLGVQEVTEFAKRLYNEGVRNGIMILKGSITALAKQVILN